MLLDDFAEWSKFSDAGISEHYIDSPPDRNGLVQKIEVGQFRNVSLNTSNIAANWFRDLVEFLLATTRDEAVGALFTQSFAVANPIPVVPPVITATFP
jgi:hypothetical protein